MFFIFVMCKQSFFRFLTFLRRRGNWNNWERWPYLKLRRHNNIIFKSNFTFVLSESVQLLQVSTWVESLSPSIKNSGMILCNHFVPNRAETNPLLQSAKNLIFSLRDCEYCKKKETISAFFPNINCFNLHCIYSNAPDLFLPQQKRNP